MSTKDTEREHANATALTALSGMSMAERRPIKVRDLADLIARERAAARAEGRAEALEEAARECEEAAIVCPGQRGAGANYCAFRIRALATKTGGSND